MKITIHQPNFIPYLGFFEKCDYSDVLVIYDSTQFKKNDFQNRNKIRTKEGWMWMTVPVNFRFGDLISEVKISKNEWKQNHLKSIEANYSNSKYYANYIFKLKEIYSKDFEKLSDFNIELIRFLLTEFGIKTKIVLSGSLDIKSKASQALLDICKKLNATDYVSGIAGKEYLDESLFYNENIKVFFQNYQHPIYTQVFKGFQPYMGALDLLFNEGPNSINIIRAGRKYE